eukprot:1654449-Amphidinium_carterae.1
MTGLFEKWQNEETFKALCVRHSPCVASAPQKHKLRCVGTKHYTMDELGFPYYVDACLLQEAELGELKTLGPECQMVLEIQKQLKAT